ncbi:hypothetical protein [Psychrobacter cryohalolentis]|uniref:hypothetical protein n=1 Tax=Psychrobacter cryohalolentis TaxID=330922 RepID=UPI003F82C597
MATITAKISLILYLPSALWLSGCSSQNTSATITPIEPAQAIDSQTKDSKATSAYGDLNGVELVKDNRDPKDIPEAVLIGPAQALAIDSKHYAMAYGVNHTEAMRQMLIQHDNEEQREALRKEFGDRIASTGLITDPEYGILVTLTGTGKPPPDRIVYRPADTLSERETVAQAYKTMTPEGITLTQAEVDKAMELIESPTRFIVRFEVNPAAKNLTEAENQLMYERSKELNKRITMITGTSYRSDEGVYVIYVHENDAKSAGLNEEKLKKIGEEVMRMPVRIEWQNGYVMNSMGGA